MRVIRNEATKEGVCVRWASANQIVATSNSPQHHSLMVLNLDCALMLRDALIGLLPLDTFARPGVRTAPADNSASDAVAEEEFQIAMHGYRNQP